MINTVNNGMKDCCPGEPFRGDPKGLHTHDCPVYQANIDAFLKLQRAKSTVIDTSAMLRRPVGMTP